MEKLPMVGWFTVVAWVSFCGYYISHADIKLSISDLLLMMPQWCEMTDLVGTGYVVLSPQITIKYCFATVVLLVVYWFSTAEEDVEELTTDTVNQCEDATSIIEKKEIQEILLDNMKTLLNTVDFEYNHCSATIAAYNETHGKKVGGEAEWASGETSSEDEDATREVTGAKLGKKLIDTEDEQIMNFLQQPFQASTEAECKEPNIKIISNGDGNQDTEEKINA